MHCRELVELAAVCAVNGRSLIRSGRIPERALEEYWSASRERSERWMTSLANYLKLQTTSPPAGGDGPLALAWLGVRPVLEEVLVSEILTRVWTSLACLYDRRRAGSVAPIVRSVYSGQLAARVLALRVLVNGRGFSPQAAAQFNQLRRRCERWCDLLLSYLVETPPGEDELDEFAFDPQRSREFARDLAEDSESPVPLSGQLLRSSLHAAFQGVPSDAAASGELNQQIAAAVLSCFPREISGSAGLPQSSWLERITSTADDAEAMILELLALHAPTTLGRNRGPDHVARTAW